MINIKQDNYVRFGDLFFDKYVQCLCTLSWVLMLRFNFLKINFIQKY